MITQMTLPDNYDFTTKFVAYTVGSKYVGADNTLNLYIPTLMNKMGKDSSAKTTNCYLSGLSSKFVNASECKPKIDTKITSANYISAKKLYNNSWDNRKTYKTDMVYNNKKFECEFVHGLIDECSFNTDTFSE